MKLPWILEPLKGVNPDGQIAGSSAATKRMLGWTWTAKISQYQPDGSWRVIAWRIGWDRDCGEGAVEWMTKTLNALDGGGTLFVDRPA